MSPRLSPRELDVLDCLARGLSISETAAELWLTANTIKSHRKRIYAELGAHNRVQAFTAAQDAGLLADQTVS